MNSDEARQRAEESFKKEDRTRDGQKTLAEYEARALTIREKTARLKALRLAKEVQAQTTEAPPKQPALRPARRHK